MIFSSCLAFFNVSMSFCYILFNICYNFFFKKIVILCIKSIH